MGSGFTFVDHDHDHDPHCHLDFAPKGPKDQRTVMPVMPISMLVLWAVHTAVLSTLLATSSVQAVLAPNHFLGTCLTDEWVASMELSLGVDSFARDSRNRFVHPFLHASVKNPLTLVHDSRTAAADAFASSCLPSTTRIYGDGAAVDPTTGAVRDQGRTNGTLVVESATWITHGLTTLVFAIIAREVAGIPITIFADSRIALLNERMSSVGAGMCTPTHVNLEVWSHPSVLLDSYAAGDIGYAGRSGLYTTTQFVSDSANISMHPNPLYADYWKGYTLNDELIEALPVSALRNNTAFFPPREVTCANGTFSCINSCSKTRACIEREARGKECMVVVMMYGTYARGYTQSVLTHLNVPTYFCFLGYAGAQAYALDAHARGIPVLFYHYEPDLFHVAHPGVFTRVFLPRALPERVVVNTGKFGDTNASDNPVDVDYPTSKLLKFASSALSESPQVSQLIAKFSISELQINSLLARYHLASANTSALDPTFHAACSWVKDNYAVWTKWLDRKPLCELRAHAHYQLSGCQTQQTDATFESYRTITFEWNVPDPENATMGYNCDGGLQRLPPTTQDEPLVRVDRGRRDAVAKLDYHEAAV